MHAEAAYLFRHALLRDAAYAMQLPSERARLHLAAADAIEADSAFAGPMAAEIARHLAAARTWREKPALKRREAVFTRTAAEHAELQFNYRDALGLWQRLATLGSRKQAAEVLRRAGRVAVQSGESTLAEALLKRSLKLATATGDQNTQSLALGSLGNLFQQTGRLDLAVPMHERSLKILRKAKDRHREGVELGNLANLYSRKRQNKKAEALYAQTMAIHREVGNRLGEAVAMGNLAGLYQESGRVQQAEELYARSLPVLEELADRRSTGIALANLGNLYATTKRDELALTTYARALVAVRETGNRRYEGIVLGSIALLHSIRNRTLEALPLFEAALEIHAEVRNLSALGAHGCDLAMRLVQLGRTEEASVWWRKSLALLIELGDTNGAKAKRTEMKQVCRERGIEML